MPLSDHTNPNDPNGRYDPSHPHYHRLRERYSERGRRSSRGGCCLPIVIVLLGNVLILGIGNIVSGFTEGQQPYLFLGSLYYYPFIAPITFLWGLDITPFSNLNRIIGLFLCLIFGILLFLSYALIFHKIMIKEQEYQMSQRPKPNFLNEHPDIVFHAVFVILALVPVFLSFVWTIIAWLFVR